MDFYEAAEGAREIYDDLYNIQFQGKSVFGEILTLEGYPILWIYEAPFIDHYLSSWLQKLIPLLKAGERWDPQLFRSQPPSIKLMGLKFRLSHFTYWLGSNMLALIGAINCKIHGTGLGNISLGNRKIICFFTPNKKQVDTIIPLVNELKEDADLAPAVIDWSSNAVEELKRNGISYGNFDSYLDVPTIYRQFKLAREIANQWRQIKANCSGLREIYYQGYNISHLVTEILDRIMCWNIYSAIRDFLITERIVKKLDIEAVFVTNEREPKTKACIFAGRACGVKTYTCQRGIIGDHPEFGPISTDKIFVYGEFYKNNLVKRGNDPKKVITTNNPRLDMLYHKLQNSDEYEIKKKLYHTLGLKLDEQIVLIINQPIAMDVTKEDQEKMIEGSLRALKGRKNIRPVIRLHPSQGSTEIEEEAISRLEMHDVLMVGEEIDLHELLTCSRLVIMRHSTVGLDAVLLGKPMITTKLVERGRDLMPYAASGVALEARTMDEIRSHVEKILSGGIILSSMAENRKKFIREHMYQFDGKATERIIKILKSDLIDQNGKKS